MAADVMMALDGFLFGVDTAAFQKLQRTNAYKWATHERVGQGPALEFTGLAEEKISLDGVIYPTYRGGLLQIDSLRKMAQKGVPMTLMTGLGDVLGEWVILDIAEDQSAFFMKGVPQKIDFKLTLQRYDTETPAWQALDLTTQAPTGLYDPGPAPTQDWAGPYDPGPTPGEVHALPTVGQLYVSRMGDTLANIAARYYGTLQGRVIERVLGANKGLADVGAVIPGGLHIALPALPTEAAKQQLVRLWS